MNELKHNAFLNSASRSPNSAKRFLRKRFRSFDVTQRYWYFIKIESDSEIS
ncbi:hypothetical protein [Leptospira noguchii]|uniref:hypothetical protein n=1 Tax=Leptospira noguchii TaxID=28182 RepID=UPI001FB6711D|nr:hypothetical protein [Leptospira noguchii]UOG31641.1 hypothetical protein MAL06_06455 [Leptospira noguchii]